MVKSNAVSRRSRVLRYLLLLGTIAAVVAIAQTNSDQGNRKILVDGSQNPDQIPEWILWNELFQMAASHNEKLPGKGKELWIDKLGLPQKAMNELVNHGYESRELHAAANKEKDAIASESKSDSNKDKARAKFKKTQAYVESRTLELRDKLRARIGEDAFLRLQSYARLRIASQIKVGI